MATYYPSTPFPVQFINPDTGELLSGGVLRAYLAGTTTPTPMYTNGSGTSAGTSVTLNAGGYPTHSDQVIVIWLDVGIDYKFVLEDDDENGKWSVDNILSITNSFLASNVFGVCKTVADMTSASGPLLTNGQRLTSTLIQAAANTGAIIRTAWSNTTSRLGGADYEIKTLAQHRTDIGDGAWVPDGYGDHYLFGGTTYVAILNSDVAFPELFGAIGDGVADDTGPTQAAIDYGVPVIYFPRKYLVSHVDLKSGLTIRGPGEIIQKETDEVCVRALECINVRIKEITFTGTGEPGDHLVELIDSEDIDISSCWFRKSPRMGVQATNCVNVSVDVSQFNNNYYFGVQMVECTNSSITRSYFRENGDTGTHQSESTTGSPGGRGAVFWGCEDCLTSSCFFIENTEYGLRWYSESSSARINKRLIADNCFFQDNGKSDFPISNTSLSPYKIQDCTVTNIKILRTTIGEFFTYAMAVQGENMMVDKVTILNNSGTKALMLGVYSSKNTKISNFTTNNTTYIDKINTTDLVLHNVRLYGCDRFVVSVITNDHIDECYALANEGATFAVAPPEENQTGIIINNSVFDGFDAPISMGATAQFRLTNNRTFNSGSWGWAVSSENDHRGCVIFGNEWDVSRRVYEDGWHSNGARTIISHTVAPITGKWAAGDICHNTAPAAGGVPGWVCVESGAPGVWKAMASIAA